ncbi:hypothetical protein T06_7727 [Trichinella sp. T6]|nr:hypothetical protein T06_7727 [Trichinella sp. T6]
MFNKCRLFNTFIVPKLMKGATPNKLVKGVTANQMSIIGIETEPAETESQHYVHCEFAYLPLGQIRLMNSHRCEIP